MTTINVENGGTIGVYGDIFISRQKEKCMVSIQGEIAKVYPPGLMALLRDTRPVSIHTDDLPGKVLYVSSEGGDPVISEYVQIPGDVSVVWLVSEEDAKLIP